MNMEAALSQAREIACKTDPTIHLLYVKKPESIWDKLVSISFSRPIRRSVFSQEKTFGRVFEWKKLVEEENPNCSVQVHIYKGKVQKKIEEAARQLRPQLIIVAKRGSSKIFSWYNAVCPNELAQLTGSCILTIIGKAADNKLKTVVLPISSHIPRRKIEFVVELAKKYRSEIHLVAISNRVNIGEANDNVFLETYKILKTGLTNSIQYHILSGSNLSRAALHYAECINADMILVNPWSETIISNFTGKHINDMLPAGSKLKILSMTPYLDKKLQQ